LRRIHNNSSIGVCFGSRNQKGQCQSNGALFSISQGLLGLLSSKFGLNYVCQLLLGGWHDKNKLEQLLPTHPPDLNPFAIGSLKISASPDGTLKTLDITTITNQNKTKQELFLLLLTPILLYPQTICKPCSIIVYLLTLDRFMCFCSIQPKALELRPHYNSIQSWLSNGEVNLNLAEISICGLTYNLFSMY
jgi:hypothetical protein